MKFAFYVVNVVIFLVFLNNVQASSDMLDTCKIAAPAVRYFLSSSVPSYKD